MTMIAFKGHTIFCKDVKRSARFYEDVLGFAREWADDAHISLLAPVADSTSARVSLLLHPSDDPPSTALGTFVTDDVDAFVDAVRLGGGVVSSNPSDAPWGVREASVRDPDGNDLHVTGPLAAGRT